MDKKQEILNATYNLFSEKGYTLSLSEIAKAVEIKTPSLYSHFKNKDEIIELTIKQEIDHCYDTLYRELAKLEHKNCEETLKGILFTTVSYYLECGKLKFWKHIRLLQHDKLRTISIALIEQRDCYLINEIKNCLIEGIKNKEIKSNLNDGVLYLYWSLLRGIVDTMLFYEHAHAGSTIEEYTSKVWDAFWDNIKLEDHQIL